MTKKQMNIMIVSLVIMIGSFVYVYFMLGQTYQNDLAQQATLTTTNQQLQTRLATIDSLKVPMQNLQSEVQKIGTVGLPTGPDTPDFLEEMESLLSSDKDFSVQSFIPNISSAATSSVSSTASTATTSSTPSASSATSGLTQTTFTVNLVGDAGKIGNLLDLFNKSVRPMYISSVDFSAEQSTQNTVYPPNTISVVLTGVTFSLPTPAASGTTSSTVATAQ